MKKSTQTFFLIAAFVAFAFTAFSQPVANFSWTPMTPCVGATVQITDMSTPNGSITAWVYSVTGASQSTYATQNPVITFTASGIQSITEVAVMGISPSAPTTKTISILALPNVVVTGSSTLSCAGASVLLSASGAMSYTWQPGGIPGSTISVSPSVTTTYTLTGVGNNGCMQTTLFTQTVASLSVSSTSSMLCSGQSATLTASGSASYSWQPGGQTTATIAVSPTANAIYTVMNATCSLTSMFTQSVTSCTGIHELSGGTLSVILHPNPADGEFNIKSGLQMENIQVLDITGRVIYSSMNVNSQEVHLNISSFAKGIYYVRIQSGGATEIRKLVKE
jgi:PKD repeat protein